MAEPVVLVEKPLLAMMGWKMPCASVLQLMMVSCFPGRGRFPHGFRTPTLCLGDLLAASGATWAQDSSAGPGERALPLASAFGKTQHADELLVPHMLLSWASHAASVLSKADLLLQSPPSGKVLVP